MHSDIKFFLDERGYRFVRINGEVYVLVDDVIKDLERISEDLKGNSDE